MLKGVGNAAYFAYLTITIGIAWNYHVFCAAAEEILEKYPKGKYINKLIIFNCFATIKPWLDMELLSDYLSKYGIIKNSEDMELVTSPYYKPHDRMTSLLKLMERSGRSGFLAFYVGLNESAEESRGHADAVAEINRHGKDQIIYK